MPYESLSLMLRLRDFNTYCWPRTNISAPLANEFHLNFTYNMMTD